MNTERATTYFNTVAYEVVGLGTYSLWMLVEQRNIVRIRHCEGMVGSHQALLFITPFKEREVHNPQAFKPVLILQAETVGHFQTKGAKLHTCLIGIVTTENQYQVTIIGTHGCLHFCEVFRAIELVN